MQDQENEKYGKKHQKVIIGTTVKNIDMLRMSKRNKSFIFVNFVRNWSKSDVTI